jgi:virginiamycin B lyase
MREPRHIRRIGSSVACLLAIAACGGSSSSSPKPGTIKEFDLPAKAGSTHEITLGPDGAMWVTQQVQGMLIRITPNGDQRAYVMPKGSGPHGIRFDRQGHLWLTFEFDNAIAELDQQGHILRTYPIPDPKSGPHGLAVASDGAVWWTGKANGTIGRLDPQTGAMRVFKIGNPTSQPIYIDEGCGAMYFTELNAGRIGRITSQGKITEYPTPTPNSRPIAVAAHDCKIWLSEETGGRFGVLDPKTAKITEYPSGGPDAQLAGLAFDRQGTLWLAYRTPDAVGEVNPDKTVRQFPLPTKKAVLHRITQGPGNTMWFTELAVDKVGFIQTS